MTFSTHGNVLKVSDPFLLVKGLEVRVRELLDFLVFSSIFLALECVAMTYFSCYVQEVPWSAPDVIIPFLVTFGIYNLNRKTDEDEDAINREDRYQFTKRHEHSLFGCSLAAIAVALSLSAWYSLPAALITLTPFLLGIFYSVRWLPSGSRYRRLKEIPLAKNLIVCISWSLPASLLPVYLTGSTPGIKTVITCFLFFSWGVLASISPDIRDRIGDARAGVRTIPVIFGEDWTRKLLMGINLIFGCTILLSGFIFLPLSMTLLLAATILYAQVCIHFLSRPSMKNFVCDILADGQYIFFSCAILVLLAFRVAP
jgi:4-hydroxybenzoate polyprenyltransferase